MGGQGAVAGHDRPAVRLHLDLVPAEPRVYPVGRLDADTEGLLLLTNDGELAHRLTHPSFGVEKEYLAEVDGEVTRSTLRRLREGVDLDDGPTAPATVSQPSPGLLRIAIHEGRNRIVRRLFDALGHPVRGLVRTAIADVRLGDLPTGSSRHLARTELAALLDATAAGSPGTTPEPPRRTPAKKRSVVSKGHRRTPRGDRGSG